MNGIWITPIERRPTAAAEAAAPRVAVKDLFDTAGIRTTYGSAIFDRHVPERSADAVSALERSGYAVAGKANLHEFAYGITSQNAHYGTVPNPLVPALTAGGSSGGSAAAVAAGLADLGLGTDTGGSIRIPAACCGLAGFKPTHGRVSMKGCFPLAPSFDAGGPIAGDVAGCARAMAALAPVAPASIESLDEVNIGLAWLERAQPEVAGAVERALGFVPQIERIKLSLAAEVFPAFQAEIAEVHRDLFGRFGELYGDNVRGKIERSLGVDSATWDEARRARRELRASFTRALGRHDVLVAPTLPISPPPRDCDELDVRAEMTLLTFPANAVGCPALALPCGRLAGGEPVSLQVMGPNGSDGLVLAVGALLERELRHTAGPAETQN